MYHNTEIIRTPIETNPQRRDYPRAFDDLMLTLIHDVNPHTRCEPSCKTHRHVKRLSPFVRQLCIQAALSNAGYRLVESERWRRTIEPIFLERAGEVSQ